SVTERRVYFLSIGSDIQLYPKEAIPYEISFIGHPPEAKIAFTYQEVGGEDVMTYDGNDSEDLVWDKNAFNFIVYMMLDKYGVSSRENILNEFAQMGLQSVTISAAS